MFRRSGITGTNKRSDGKRSDGKRSGERFSSVGIALIAFSLCAWIVYLFLLPSTNPDIYWQTLITAAVILIGGLLLRRARRIIEKKNEAFLIITLLLFCIAVKLTWVLCFRIQPPHRLPDFFPVRKGARVTRIDLRRPLYCSVSAYFRIFRLPESFLYSVRCRGTRCAAGKHGADLHFASAHLFDLQAAVFGQRRCICLSVLDSLPFADDL